MFKQLLITLLFFNKTFANCNDPFSVNSEDSVYIHGDLIIYHSDHWAKIYNRTSSECIISFEGENRKNYPIFERIVTINSINFVQYSKWKQIPENVAIDYAGLLVANNVKGDSLSCKTNSHKYFILTTSNIGVDCSSIKELNIDHDSNEHMGGVVAYSLIFYIMLILLIISYNWKGNCDSTWGFLITSASVLAMICLSIAFEFIR